MGSGLRSADSENSFEPLPGCVTPRDRELLTGMGNCFEACHGTFEETLEMVAGARHRAVGEVRSRLSELRAEAGGSEEYRHLRARLPADFPL